MIIGNGLGVDVISDFYFDGINIVLVDISWMSLWLNNNNIIGN